MAEAARKYISFILPIPGAVAFAHLTKPDPGPRQAKVGNKNPRYSITVAFDKATFAESGKAVYGAAVAEAVKNNFPWTSIKELHATKNLRLPLQDGDQLLAKAKENAERQKVLGKDGKVDPAMLKLYPGAWVLKFESDNPPVVSKLDASGDPTPSDPSVVYRGSFVYVSGAMTAYEGGNETVKEAVGIKIYLDEVLFARDGEKIAGGGGRPPAGNVFKGIIPKIATDTSDLHDDEIPF